MLFSFVRKKKDKSEFQTQSIKDEKVRDFFKIEPVGIDNRCPKSYLVIKNSMIFLSVDYL